MVSAGGGCEPAVTARTRCGWAKLRECSKQEISSKAERGCTKEFRKDSNTVWK